MALWRSTSEVARKGRMTLFITEGRSLGGATALPRPDSWATGSRTSVFTKSFLARLWTLMAISVLPVGSPFLVPNGELGPTTPALKPLLAVLYILLVTSRGTFIPPFYPAGKNAPRCVELASEYIELFLLPIVFVCPCPALILSPGSFQVYYFAPTLVPYTDSGFFMYFSGFLRSKVSTFENLLV